MSENTNDIQTRRGLEAILFAAFSAAALAAFLWYRGSDIGALPGLVGNLGGGPLSGYEGAWNSFVGTLMALAIVASWFGLGSVAARVSRIERTGETSALLDVVVCTAIGAAIWSLIWFFAGLAGVYYWWFGVAALTIGLACAVFAYVVRSPMGYDERDPSTWLDKLLFALIAVQVLLAFVSSLAPPTAKDTLLYHFAVPKGFIAQHSSAYIEGNIASYLALGTEMHGVWAMLIGGMVGPRTAEAAAGVTVFLFFPLLLAAIFGWARQMGISRRWSLTATVMVAAVPTAYHVASSGYIDIALALFVTLAVYELGRWWRFQEDGSLLYIAIFLGAALSIKLTAVFVFAAVALMILLRAREASNAGRIAAAGFGALVLAGVIAAPWYLRTWAATGSPVFPFYMSIWKGEAIGWDVERSNLFQAMNSQYGGENKSALDYLAAPINVSITAQPEIPARFDGVLGVAFLIGLPLIVLALWKFELQVDIKVAAGVAAVVFLFWLFSSQQLRYLLPILPLLAIAVSASAEAISGARWSLSSVFQYSLIAAVISASLTSAAWFMQKAPLRVALGGESRDAYLTRNLDYYPYYQRVNAAADKDKKVWLINMRRDTYNIDRPVFSDYLFEDWTLRKLVWESRSILELRSKVAAMGVDSILTRHDFLFDYDRTSLVDDNKPRAENEAKLKLARELLMDQPVMSNNKFSLVKVN